MHFLVQMMAKLEKDILFYCILTYMTAIIHPSILHGKKSCILSMHADIEKEICTMARPYNVEHSSFMKCVSLL